MSEKFHRPPVIVRWMLKKFLPETDTKYLCGDFDEIYNAIFLEDGWLAARLWYWSQLIITIPSIVIHLIYWRIAMFANYVKIAWRNIKKHKGYSFINITGLAIGMACCILILMWVQDELSFDRFHEKKEDIYRVISDWEKHNWKGMEGTPGPLAPAMEEAIPEVLFTARLAGHSRMVFKYGDKVFYEDRGVIADPALFNIFTFPVLKGNVETAFSKPTDIVITESMADKYFGAQDPMGKVIDVEGQMATVTGVIQDPPHNSHLQFDYMSSFEFIRDLSGYGTTWGSFNFVTYTLLQKNVNPDIISQKLTDVAMKNECPQVKDGASFRLQRLLDVHLDARRYQRAGYVLGDQTTVTLFSVIAIFVLLIACVNFMNLSTARSSIRAKEVGLRKTVGADRSQIIKQFFGESILLSTIACLFALILVFSLLPRFNALSAKQLSVDLTNGRFVFSFLGVVLLTGLISGSYPALFLSSYKPVVVLREAVSSGKKGSVFRRIFVVFQFSLSILLIIGTFIIYKQLHFIRNKELGFDKDHIVFIPIKENMGAKYETAKNELLRDPNILSVTACWNHFPSDTWRGAGFEWEGGDPVNQRELDLVYTGVDYDFFQLLGLEIVDGRPFSKEYASDENNAYILNQAAIENMELDDPVGKQFNIPPDDRGPIVGIVKDVHFQSLHRKIEPRIFFLYDMAKATTYGILLAKVRGGRIPQALAGIQRVWGEMNPISPFEYHFLDETYDQLYRKEQRVGSILNYFTFLAVLISCLGLFGLASFMAERRTKEIGIRKVLGAPVSGLVVLLSKEFSRWVLISNIIAWPIGYFAMKKMLQSYAYRTPIGIEIFILSALLALVIALLTVSFQAVKAARANPVESLRYE